MPVTLVAHIEQTPEPHTASHSHLQKSELTAEGDNYDSARDRLRDQLPNGWQLISIRRVD